MPSASARPFYAEYAWAYDLLSDRPVRKECSTIATWLINRGVFPGATVLDAGCGTGRYSRELARRGFVVQGIDASAELIAEANSALPTHSWQVSFAVENILALPVSRYDAILCRGVLNDLVDEGERHSVFSVFGRALRHRGVLIADLREWHATADRKSREPLFRKRVATNQGTLTFTAVTELDHPTHRLIVNEQHALEADGHERSSDYQFVMQCWTSEELQALLSLAGFDPVAYFGAYDPLVPVGATDRLVVVAQHSSSAA